MSPRSPVITWRSRTSSAGAAISSSAQRSISSARPPELARRSAIATAAARAAIAGSDSQSGNQWKCSTSPVLFTVASVLRPTTSSPATVSTAPNELTAPSRCSRDQSVRQTDANLAASRAISG